MVAVMVLSNPHVAAGNKLKPCATAMLGETTDFDSRIVWYTTVRVSYVTGCCMAMAAL